MAEDLKARARQLFEDIWNNGRMDLAGEYFTEDACRRVADSPIEVRGRAAIVDLINGLRRGFPHCRTVLHDAVQEGARVACQWTWTGTHSGEFGGLPATGRTVTLEGVELLRFAGDKVAEAVVYENYDHVLALLSGDRSLNEEQKLAAIRRCAREVWGEGNPRALEEICTRDFVYHGNGTTRSLEGYVQTIQDQAQAFPRGRYQIEEMIACGNRVAARWHFEGLHQGELKGKAPTGRRVMLDGVTIFRFKENRVSEMWACWDDLSLSNQLGLTAGARAAEAPG